MSFKSYGTQYALFYIILYFQNVYINTHFSGKKFSFKQKLFLF